MAATTPGKDPLLINKVAGAVLATLLFVMALSLGAEAIFKPAKPVVPGYELPGVEEASAPADAVAPQAAPPIAERLAKADVARGETVARQCVSCHSLKSDGSGARVGPSLHGVVGRAKASTNFSGYSSAMKAHAGETWAEEEIDKFLANPKAAVPGTTMNFAGVANADRRGDLIGYLQTLK